MGACLGTSKPPPVPSPNADDETEARLSVASIKIDSIDDLIQESAPSPKKQEPNSSNPDLQPGPAESKQDISNIHERLASLGLQSQTDDDDLTDWTKVKANTLRSTKDSNSNIQECTDLESNVDAQKAEQPSYLAKQAEVVAYARSQYASDWTIEDVETWILDIGLANYASEFLAHEINGKKLIALDYAQLKRTLLITNTADLQKLTMEITKLRVIDNQKNTSKHVRKSSRNREIAHIGMPTGI